MLDLRMYNLCVLPHVYLHLFKNSSLSVESFNYHRIKLLGCNIFNLFFQDLLILHLQYFVLSLDTKTLFMIRFFIFKTLKQHHFPITHVILYFMSTPVLVEYLHIPYNSDKLEINKECSVHVSVY